MPKLVDILDTDLLRHHMDEGVVRRQVHPLYPELYIYNYTEQAQFGRIWDNVTRQCRGLITADGEVIARGFNKFFNLNTEFAPETLEANLPDEEPLALEKLDGSLGILYRWDGQLWMATRGSFDSVQSRWATKWLREHDAQISYQIHYEATPNFEIIYAENRIVVDYDYEDCVLLGLVALHSGKELDRADVKEFADFNNFNLVKRHHKSLAECVSENIGNAEGYVLTYSTGLKVKVKFEDYCRLHRILTGLNPRSVWEMLVPPSMLVQQSKEQVNPEDVVAEARAATVDSIQNDPKMPADFLMWFNGWVGQLRGKYTELEKRAQEIFLDRKFQNWANEPSPEAMRMARKAHAEYFKRTPELCGILFAMLDGKAYDDVIWKMIKPRGDAPFKKDGE